MNFIKCLSKASEGSRAQKLVVSGLSDPADKRSNKMVLHQNYLKLILQSFRDKFSCAVACNGLEEDTLNL
jgi:hypothetical protein